LPKIEEDIKKVKPPVVKTPIPIAAKAPVTVAAKPSLQAPVTPAPGMANAGTAPPFASGARVAPPPATTWPSKGSAGVPVAPRPPAVVPPKPSLQAPPPTTVPPAPKPTAPATAPKPTVPAKAKAPAPAKPRAAAVVPPIPAAPKANAVTPGAGQTFRADPRFAGNTFQTDIIKSVQDQFGAFREGESYYVDPQTGEYVMMGSGTRLKPSGIDPKTGKPSATMEDIFNWLATGAGQAGQRVDPATGQVTIAGPTGETVVQIDRGPGGEKIPTWGQGYSGEQFNWGNTQALQPSGAWAPNQPAGMPQQPDYGALDALMGAGGMGGGVGPYPKGQGGIGALDDLLRAGGQTQMPPPAGLPQPGAQPPQIPTPALQALQDLASATGQPTQGLTQAPAAQIGGKPWQTWLEELFQSSTGGGQTAEQIAASQYGDIEYRRQQERANLEQEKQKALEAISAQYAAQGTWKSGLREQSEGNLEDKYQKALADINQRHDVARQQALGTAQQQLTQQQQWGYGAGSQLASTVLGQEQWQQQFGLAQRPYSEMTMAEKAQAALAQLPYEQMTKAQQTEAQLALQQLAQSRELGMMPYQQATAGDKLSALLQQQQMKQQGSQFQQQFGLSQQQLAQEGALARMPYGQLTAAQQAQMGLGQQQLGWDVAQRMGYLPQDIGGVKAGTRLPTQTQAQGQKDVFLEGVYAKLNAGQPLTSQEALAALGSSSYQAGAPQTGFTPSQGADEARQWYGIYADPMTPAAQKQQAFQMYQYYSQFIGGQNQPGMWQQPPQMLSEQQQIDQTIQELKAQGMSDAQIDALFADNDIRYGQYGKKKVGGAAKGG